ncbi:MAG: hypothetical protein A2487_11535 [Candidatus Raymondbacteria bacterium RifOxyC12_full_50_8]|nr:MAG: hypothetical protein A2487_11535 [Candidatus Raymondbacteria bacterium RifOxyC12_full_50_8]OGK02728.1 MAG: hypothetical protein A2350_07150 [Candidatus Raymondbacteria bacterium RifOxyB12_full_50_8]
MINSIGSVDTSSLMSQMAAKMFKRLDTNEDGGIDKTELQAMLDKGKKQGPSVDEIFEKMDTNKDGKIDEEEHTKALEQRRTEMDQMRAQMQGRMVSAEDSSERASEMFAKLDTNSDGGIDKTEMQAMVDQGGGRGPSVDEIFEKLDTNGDGKIDEEENAEALKNAPPPPPPEMSDNSENSGDAITALIQALSRSDDDESSSLVSKLADTLLEHLDADGNGNIDKDELVSSLKEAFQQSYTQEGSLSANLNLSGTLLNAMA